MAIILLDPRSSWLQVGAPKLPRGLFSHSTET